MNGQFVQKDLTFFCHIDQTTSSVSVISRFSFLILKGLNISQEHGWLPKADKVAVRIDSAGFPSRKNCEHIWR